MAELPFFYSDELAEEEIVLNEETSKHVVQVLRMSTGNQLHITDGKGQIALTTIIDNNRKKCKLKIESIDTKEPLQPEVAIAISLLKSNTRFEWFLEKATEVGVNKFIPLICSRTHKDKVRQERLQNILISAMLQSQQCWLPILEEPTEFDDCLKLNYGQSCIAHCESSSKHKFADLLNNGLSKLILIGPEGDFTPAEIEAALTSSFVPVSLGDTRLRSETSGIVAATLMRQCC